MKQAIMTAPTDRAPGRPAARGGPDSAHPVKRIGVCGSDIHVFHASIR